jgi:hypothetical protein
VAQAIAIFFMLFTGFDLSAPQPCGEELLGLSADQIAALSVTRSVNETGRSPISVFISTSDNSQREEPQEQHSDDDDCFCCCAHVLPGMIFSNADSVELKQSSSPREYLASLSPALPGTFHPPRFA